MRLEDNTSLKASSPTSLAGETKADEEEELAELEFEEDQPDTRVVSLPVLSQPTPVPEEAEKEEAAPQAQAEFTLPLIFQQSGLDLVLKLHPQPQAQLWVGLRSGQQPPLLRVFDEDELDLAKLASQLVPLLKEYARQIEATKVTKAVAPSKPKAEATLPAVVPPSQKSAGEPASVKPTQSGPTGKEKDKDKDRDKDLEQLSFF